VAVLVPLDDARVDIGGSGDGRGITQVVGDFPDDAGDGVLAGSVAVGAFGDG